MSWVIGSITLPRNPNKIKIIPAADIKSLPLFTELPLLIPLGPSTRVLDIEGIISNPGDSLNVLKSNYIDPLQFYVETEVRYPFVICDDDMVDDSFWTVVYNAGTGIAAITPSDDAVNKSYGEDCWSAVTSGGTSYISWYLSHVFSPAVDLSKADFLSFRIYQSGAGASPVIRVQFNDKGAVDHSNKYYCDVTVTPDSWHREVTRADQWTLVGSVNLSAINFVWIEWLNWPLPYPFTTKIDRFVFGIGVLVNAPETRYDGIYIIKKFPWIETGGRITSLLYKMTLWSSDDYY